MLESVFGVRLADVNPHLVCALCGGYLVNATTVSECCHSCRRAKMYVVYLHYMVKRKMSSVDDRLENVG